MDRRIGLGQILAALFLVAAPSATLTGSTLAGAQPVANPPSTAGLPPPPSLGPLVAPPPPANAAIIPVPNTAHADTGPPRPERNPAAVIRVLDKVTAETLRFAAPVGRKIRYKNLVFEVKACEIRAPGSADPRASAYVLIDADLGAAADGSSGSKQIYKGWIFAQAPGVHALQHPIYDAWLESCIAQAPGI